MEAQLGRATADLQQDVSMYGSIIQILRGTVGNNS